MRFRKDHWGVLKLGMYSSGTMVSQKGGPQDRLCSIKTIESLVSYMVELLPVTVQLKTAKELKKTSHSPYKEAP